MDLSRIWRLCSGSIQAFSIIPKISRSGQVRQFVAHDGLHVFTRADYKALGTNVRGYGVGIADGGEFPVINSPRVEDPHLPAGCNQVNVEHDAK